MCTTSEVHTPQPLSPFLFTGIENWGCNGILLSHKKK